MNVAVAVARLGGPSAFVGCLSTDEHGAAIRRHLEANGVEVSACQYSPAPTARAIVEHVPQLRFRFEGDSTADTLLDRFDVDALGGVPAIIHGGTLGLFRGRTAETLAQAVEAHPGIVSLDPNIRPQILDDRAAWLHFHDRWLAHTSIYKGSDEDLAWIWPDRSPQDCVDHLLDRGAQAVILTLGAEGLSISTADGTVQAPAPTIEVVDTVGAGDTIVGAVLTSVWELGLADGGGVQPPGRLPDLSSDQWHTIARRATQAAAITCSRAGADVPFRHELDW